MAYKKFKNQAIEFLTFLSLILVGFKLSGSIIAIDWSWWLVLSPLSVLMINYLILGLLIINKIAEHNRKNQHSFKKTVYIK